MTCAISPVLVTPPTEYPVSVEEAKAQLRVTTDADDLMIEAMIETATQSLDGPNGALGRCIMPQMWRFDLDQFGTAIYLPFGDVMEIDAITYTDADGVGQTVSSAAYVARKRGMRWSIELAPTYSWPTSFATADDVVQATVLMGMDTVPAGIKQAILLMVGHLYSTAKAEQGLKKEVVEGVGSREWHVSKDTIDSILVTHDSLISRFRVPVL